jgi:hypothetical protein
MEKWVRRAGYSIVAAASLFAVGCGGAGGGNPASPGTVTASGATLTGQIVSFTVAWQTEPKGFLADLMDFVFPTAHAAQAGVTVSVGSVSTTTDSAGRFTLGNIPTGDQVVTFAEGSNSASYTLMGVEPNETIVLNGTSIAGSTVTTVHTGSWVGTATTDGEPGTVSVTLTIAANANAVEGTIDLDDGWEVISWSGTENGTSVSGSFHTVESGAGCTGEHGTFSGSFDGSTVSGTWRDTGTVAGCEINQGTFTLNKQ